MSDPIHCLQKKNYHFRLLIFCICFVSVYLFQTEKSNAQEHFDINKFIESLGDYPDDSLAYILYQKSQNYINADSLEFANELLINSIDIAQQQHDTLLIGLCKLQQGRIFNDLLKFNNSFQAYNQAYEISININDTNIMIRAMKGIESYYGHLEMIDSAIIYCSRAISINKAQKNYYELTFNYQNLFNYQSYSGYVYEGGFVIEGLWDSSLMAARKSGDSRLLCGALTNFGMKIINDYPEKAYQLFYTAIDSARKLPVPSQALVYALTKTSDMFFQVNKDEEAEIFLREAYALIQKTKDKRQLTNLTYLFGDMMYKKDSISEAIEYYSDAIELAEKYRYNYYLPYIYKRLFNLYYSEKMFDSSYVFQQKYMEAFKKKHNREISIQVAKLSAKYEFEQKVEVIDNLTIINNQKKTMIANQRKFIIMLAFAIIAISGLFVFMYYHFKKIKKVNRKLSQNAIELNIKNKEIAEFKKKREDQLEVVHDDLKDKLEELFENGEIYIKKDLTLNSTALALKTNTSYLSGIINQDYECNFSQFVNKYRVKKACEFLSNRKKDIYTIESIGESVGFKSKSVFNQAFKEATGVNPSTFRKNIIGMKGLQNN